MLPAPARYLALLALAVLLALAGTVAVVGVRTRVAPRSELAPTGPPARPDDGLWAAVLERHVDERGNVDYAALQSAPDDLERYYAQLAAVSPDSHPELFADTGARLAYWLNAYNAATLVSVTRLWPLESVTDLGAPWFAFFLRDTAGFFYFREHVLGGEALSLYALENDVIRERFADARIHFALNCASAGCPRLPREPFVGGRLDEQLDRETRAFLAEARNLTIDDGAQVVWLSQLFEWYAADFLAEVASRGDEGPTLVDYIARHVPAETAATLRQRGASYERRSVPYDWRVNARGLERYPVPGAPIGR